MATNDDKETNMQTVYPDYEAKPKVSHYRSICLTTAIKTQSATQRELSSCTTCAHCALRKLPRSTHTRHQVFKTQEQVLIQPKLTGPVKKLFNANYK